MAARDADMARGKRTASMAVLIAQETRWIRLRIAGWLLIGAWQVLSLASEFVPLDLNARPVRILGKVLGLVGIVLIGYGFERLMVIAHEKANIQRI